MCDEGLFRDDVTSLLAEEFRSVDSQSSTAQIRCLQCLEFIRKSAQFETVRQLGRKYLRLGDDVSSVLDIGCGLGDDCLHFADVLNASCSGNPYRVFGLDASETFLNVAAKRVALQSTAMNRVTFIQSDARGLSVCKELVPRSLDRVYEERTFQHISRADCASVVRQIASLLKPGGVFVSVEPCWELFTLYPGELRISRYVRDYWADSFNHGDIALRLPTLLRESGFCDVTVEFVPVEYRNFADADTVYDLTRTINTLSIKGVISEIERDTWLQVQQTASDSYCSVLMMAVISGVAR